MLQWVPQKSATVQKRVEKTRICYKFTLVPETIYASFIFIFLFSFFWNRIFPKVKNDICGKGARASVVKWKIDCNGWCNNKNGVDINDVIILFFIWWQENKTKMQTNVRELKHANIGFQIK